MLFVPRGLRLFGRVVYAWAVFQLLLVALWAGASQAILFVQLFTGCVCAVSSFLLF
jgi:hypothetical protein